MPGETTPEIPEIEKVKIETPKTYADAGVEIKEAATYEDELLVHAAIAEEWAKIVEPVDWNEERKKRIKESWLDLEPNETVEEAKRRVQLSKPRQQNGWVFKDQNLLYECARLTAESDTTGAYKKLFNGDAERMDRAELEKLKRAYTLQTVSYYYTAYQEGSVSSWAEGKKNIGLKQVEARLRGDLSNHIDEHGKPKKEWLEEIKQQSTIETTEAPSHKDDLAKFKDKVSEIYPDGMSSTFFANNEKKLAKGLTKKIERPGPTTIEGAKPFDQAKEQENYNIMLRELGSGTLDPKDPRLIQMMWIYNKQGASVGRAEVKLPEFTRMIKEQLKDATLVTVDLSRTAVPTRLSGTAAPTPTVPAPTVARSPETLKSLKIRLTDEAREYINSADWQKLALQIAKNGFKNTKDQAAGFNRQLGTNLTEIEFKTLVERQVKLANFDREKTEQSPDFVRHFTETFLSRGDGEDALREAIKAVRSGEDPAQAIENARKKLIGMFAITANKTRPAGDPLDARNKALRTITDPEKFQEWFLAYAGTTRTGKGKKATEPTLVPGNTIPMHTVNGNINRQPNPAPEVERIDGKLVRPTPEEFIQDLRNRRGGKKNGRRVAPINNGEIIEGEFREIPTQAPQLPEAVPANQQEDAISAINNNRVLEQITADQARALNRILENGGPEAARRIKDALAGTQYARNVGEVDALIQELEPKAPVSQTAISDRLARGEFTDEQASELQAGLDSLPQDEARRIGNIAYRGADFGELSSLIRSAQARTNANPSDQTLPKGEMDANNFSKGQGVAAPVNFDEIANEEAGNEPVIESPGIPDAQAAVLNSLQNHNITVEEARKMLSPNNPITPQQQAILNSIYNGGLPAARVISGEINFTI